MVRVITRRFAFERNTKDLTVYNTNRLVAPDGRPFCDVLCEMIKPPPPWQNRIEVQISSNAEHFFPQLTVPLIGADDILALGEEWPIPVPLEFDERVRVQLRQVFRCMSAIHIQERDLPTELQLKVRSGIDSTFFCIASGYRNPIGYHDMIRLYLCAPTQIRNVYYDCSLRRQDASAVGGLVVELLADRSDNNALTKNERDNADAFETLGLARVVKIYDAAPLAKKRPAPTEDDDDTSEDEPAKKQQRVDLPPSFTSNLMAGLRSWRTKRT